MRPVIGVSMSRDETTDLSPRDWIRESYLKSVEAAGGLPCPLPNRASAVELLETCDGLLLTGGGDFDPATFGAPDLGTHWDGVSAARDQTELALIAAADRLGMPVFGICRGLQALTVAAGGDLIQDIPTARPDSPLVHRQTLPREETVHAVTLDLTSRVGRLVGLARVEVNTFHHQAVGRMPPGWVVAGRADDGVVEAIEKPGERFQVGVQWHPEDLVGSREEALRLFNGFVEAARAFRQRRERG